MMTSVTAVFRRNTPTIVSVAHPRTGKRESLSLRSTIAKTTVGRREIDIVPVTGGLDRRVNRVLFN